MNEKQQLLQQIQQLDFALYDLMLYLDTHPKCRKALALYDKYRSQRDKAVQTYVQKFGVLQADQQNSPDRWEWNASPYPWEKECD